MTFTDAYLQLSDRLDMVDVDSNKINVSNNGDTLSTVNPDINFKDVASKVYADKFFNKKIVSNSDRFIQIDDTYNLDGDTVTIRFTLSDNYPGVGTRYTASVTRILAMVNDEYITVSGYDELNRYISLNSREED